MTGESLGLRMSELLSRLRSFLAGPWGFLLPLIVLAPLALGTGVYEKLFGGANGATVQKIAVLVLLAIAALILGLRLPPWPIWVILGAVTVAFFVGVVINDRGNGILDSTLLRGAVGYAFPWLAFFVDWRPVSQASRALSLALLAPFAVMLGSVIHLVNLGNLFRHEYTGAVRLAAAMPPAHLAALAIFSVVGGVWLWVMGRRAGLWLALLSAAICGLTGTRGALIAAGIIFGGTLVVALCYKLPYWKAGLVSGVAGVVGGSFLILPNLLKRAAQEAHGALALSGREEAWAYFLGRLAERPFVGYGPGGATELSQQSGNTTITRSFVSPHSAYISLLVDVGWPLFLALALGIGGLLVMVVRANVGPVRWMAGLLGAACVFYGAFDNLLNAAQSAVPFALTLAMMFAPAMTPRSIAEEVGERALLRRDLRPR